WSACSAAIQLGIPVTSDFRTRFDEYSDAYGMKALVPVVRSYLRSFHNRTLCTFVPTQEIATHLEHHGFNDLVVSGRGVDTIAFSPLYRSETLRRSWKAMGPVALYVGRLAAEKNLFAVVEAFEAMRSIEPNAKLVLVGDGPLRDALKERCPDAIFAGMQCGADLAAHYASADIFLFASLTETFGNVTLEAMACGLPVVAYDIAAAAIHIRDGCNGITVSPGDHAAFSAAAMRLAYNEPLRERLGEAARLTARGAGWDRILADFESALLAATSSANSDVSPCLV
ncbi:MAG TPA: glycosyltransferase family 1 protein, partial [Rhodocyclaceae bacterium]|nr:glycosyltransferase family 1 protein [Rhodocyclaceae bacterium]